MNDHEYLLSNIQNIKGIGKKTSQLFKRKNINTIFDLLWHLPTSKIENSNEFDDNILLKKLIEFKKKY